MRRQRRVFVLESVPVNVLLDHEGRAVRRYGKGTNMHLKTAAIVGAVAGALVLLGLISFIFSSVFS